MWTLKFALLTFKGTIGNLADGPPEIGSSLVDLYFYYYYIETSINILERDVHCDMHNPIVIFKVKHGPCPLRGS